MRSVSVEFECEIPEGVDATDREIEAWVRFCLGASSHLSFNNPLIDYDLEAVFGSVWVTP